MIRLALAYFAGAITATFAVLGLWVYSEPPVRPVSQARLDELLNAEPEGV